MYKAQADNPVKGDFTELVKDDFKLINEKQEDDEIRMKTKVEYKKQVKTKIKTAALYTSKTNNKNTQR